MAKKLSEMRQLTDYFCDQYAKYNCVPYLFKRLDAMNLAKLLKGWGLPLSKAVVDEALSGRFKLRRPIDNTNSIIYFANSIAAQVGQHQNFLEEPKKTKTFICSNCKAQYDQCMCDRVYDVEEKWITVE